MTERFRHWQERTREPSLTVWLVVALLLLFVIIPLEANHLVPTAILNLTVALFLIGSFLVTLQSRVAMLVLVVSAIVAQIAAIKLQLSCMADTHLRSQLGLTPERSTRHSAL